MDNKLRKKLNLIFWLIFVIEMIFFINVCESSTIYWSGQADVGGTVAAANLSIDNPTSGLFGFWVSEPEYSWETSGNGYSTQDVAVAAMEYQIGSSGFSWSPVMPSNSPPIDNTPVSDNTTNFGILMGRLDNISLKSNNIKYQHDLILGAVFSVVFVAGFRWYL